MSITELKKIRKNFSKATKLFYTQLHKILKLGARITWSAGHYDVSGRILDRSQDRIKVVSFSSGKEYWIDQCKITSIR